MSWRISYLLFFFSGVAGLIYEIVWGRMLVLVFGSTTNSLVAVISAFLGGLALGNMLFGKLADNLSPKHLIRVYLFLEFGVGITALLSLFLIPGVKNFYYNFSDGSSVTLPLLITKFLFSSLIILVPTILMGGTLPILVRFVKSQVKISDKVVSYLYGVNTLGGVFGIILAAFVFIETFGLTKTLIIAAIINFLVSLAALAFRVKGKETVEKNISKVGFLSLINKKVALILVAFFLSGLVSIAYQILWTRVLTPVVGTVIYAFATILAIYLVGLALGSLVFGALKKVVKDKLLLFVLSEIGIGVFVVFSVLITHKFSLSREWELFVRIVPPTLFMGLTFPAVVNLIGEEKHAGKVVGLSYFANTLGAILGGYLSSYFFIPKIGTSQSIVLLASFNFLIAAVFLLQKISLPKPAKTALLLLTLTLTFGSLYLSLVKGHRLLPYDLDFKIADAQISSYPFIFKEDEVASVFAYQNAPEHQEGLLIDGVATTSRVAETRLMAQIPFTLVARPKDALVIAFGMGTTFSSSLKLGMKTDAVELVPTVPQTMWLFNPNASKILTDPKGKVIINDGRNYAFLTRKKYDVIIIDPPPPFVTAGSTVLHSKEFYQDLSKDLKNGGMVNQWIYYYRSREDEISMAIRSFLDVFPYVLAVQKKDSVGGLYMLGSHTPIDSTKLNNLKNNQIALADLQEVLGPDFSFENDPLIEVVGTRESMIKHFSNFPPITDDYPRSEYYLLRHSNTESPELVTENALNFISRIKSEHSSNP